LPLLLKLKKQLTINQCAEILNRNENKYTEEQIAEIRVFLYKLLEIAEIGVKYDLQEKSNSI